MNIPDPAETQEARIVEYQAQKQSEAALAEFIPSQIAAAFAEQGSLPERGWTPEYTVFNRQTGSFVHVEALGFDKFAPVGSKSAVYGIEFCDTEGNVDAVMMIGGQLFSFDSDTSQRSEEELASWDFGRFKPQFEKAPKLQEVWNTARAAGSEKHISHHGGSVDGHFRRGGVVSVARMLVGNFRTRINQQINKLDGHPS